MQINLPALGRCPIHSDSSGKNYCELFKQHKIRDCFVLLCPPSDTMIKLLHERKEPVDLESIKNFKPLPKQLRKNLLNNRGGKADLERINNFDLKKCFILIRKLQNVVVKPYKEFKVYYSMQFLREWAFDLFLKSRNDQQHLSLDNFYEQLESKYWNLDKKEFARRMLGFFQGFLLDEKKNIELNKEKNRNRKRRIRIETDAAKDIDTMSLETVDKVTSPQARFELCEEVTRDSLESGIRQNGPGNLDFQETKLPEKIADLSTPNIEEVQLLPSTAELALEILQEQPLQGRIEEDQHLLEIKSKAPALEILLHHPSPEKKDTDCPKPEIEGRKPAVEILLEQTSQSIEAVQCLPEIKGIEPDLEIILEKPYPQKIADYPVPEIEGRKPALEILQEHPSQENIKVDQILPELKEKEPALEMLEEQLLREEIEVDQPSSGIEEKVQALELLQEQPVQENIKNDLSVLEIEVEKPVLEMSQEQPLLEKANLHSSDKTEYPPLIEAKHLGIRKRKHSCESPTQKKKQKLEEVVQKLQRPEIIVAEVIQKDVADQMENEPLELTVESRARKYAQMQKQQALEKRMHVAKILNQPNHLTYVQRPTQNKIPDPWVHIRPARPNSTNRMAMQHPAPVGCAAVNALPHHSSDGDRTDCSDLDDYSVKSHSSDSDRTRYPSDQVGGPLEEHDHNTDSDLTIMSDQIEEFDAVGIMNGDMRNRNLKNGGIRSRLRGNGDFENHFVSSRDTEGEWSDSILKKPEAEQSRRSSVIKQTVKSNGNIVPLVTKVL